MCVLQSVKCRSGDGTQQAALLRAEIVFYVPLVFQNQLISFVYFLECVRMFLPECVCVSPQHMQLLSFI